MPNETSRTVTVFEAHTAHLSIEEVIRSEAFNMQFRHYHSGYEIYYLMEGRRYYFIDRRVFFAEAGNLIFIDKNRVHKTSLADNPYHHRLLIQVEEHCMDRWIAEAVGGKLAALFHDEMSVVSLSEEERTLLEKKLKEIKREASVCLEGYEEMLDCLVLQILILACRAKNRSTLPSPLLPLTGEKVKTVSQVAGYLAANYQKSDSLEEIAGRFFINKYYLSRIFRQVTGVTMREYLHIQRIQKAQEFLKSSLMSVTEIAQATGFENVSYFEKIFRRCCGMTPKEYRKSQKQGPV